MSPQITLRTGRTVLHRPFRATNGVLVPDLEEAFFADGSEMTPDEWREYCEIVKRRNHMKLAKQHARRAITRLQNETLEDIADLADEMGMDDVAERLREQAEEAQ